VALPGLVAAPEAAGNGEALRVPAADRRAHIRHTLHTRLLSSVTNPPSTFSLVPAVPFPVGQIECGYGIGIIRQDYCSIIVSPPGAYSEDCRFESWTLRSAVLCSSIPSFFIIT
jgi:hypothetical protein